MVNGISAFLDGSISFFRGVILDADVAKRAAHHDIVVAPSRAVLVEVLWSYLPLEEILSSGALFLDRASRRNVVGGDLVAEQTQDAGAYDVYQRRKL